MVLYMHFSILVGKSLNKAAIIRKKPINCKDTYLTFQVSFLVHLFEERGTGISTNIASQYLNLGKQILPPYPTFSKICV